MSIDEDYMTEYLAVANREKPLMICEQRKAPQTYTAIKRLALLIGAPHAFDVFLADGGGANRAALVVTRDANLYQDFLELRARREVFSRKNWQYQIGRLLGHTPEDCAKFSESKIGLSCECELCGGQSPETVLELRDESDAHVRRTMFHL